MSSRALRWAVTVAVSVVALAATAAYASGTPNHARTPHAVAHATGGQTYSLSFSPNHPSYSSAFSFTIKDPTQPSSVEVSLPAGTVFNPSAVPVCSTPPQCDPSTQIGTGSATVDYNSYVIPLSFAVFNVKGGLAIVIALQNASPVLLLGTWSGDNLSLNYPDGTYKGVPIITVALTLSFNQLGNGRNAFIRTPSKCPKSGWASNATLTFAGGTTAAETAHAKCALVKKKAKKKKKKK